MRDIDNCFGEKNKVEKIKRSGVGWDDNFKQESLGL